jgi:S-adenosylmethionine:tRNA ribosyltransferase-isomerase
LRTALFDYELPESRIARHPLSERDQARLLVLDRGRVEHRRVSDLAELIPADALVVVNDTRVRHARVLAERAETGGAVELLFLARLDASGSSAVEIWEALGRANKALRPGAAVVAAGFRAEVREVLGRGLIRVAVRAEGGLEAWLAAYGRVPLPPYLGRADELEDRERYQTVFADKVGSSAAPTAGLHLSDALLAALRARGVEVETVTLGIGLGTFRPVEVDDLDDHDMHAEPVEVGTALVDAVARARKRKAPVVAIGTTVVRTLESAADPESPGAVRPFRAQTRLLIQPGYAFSVVDALLTNFHQPRSTLLALVSAFAGRDAVFSAYRAALDAGYRFLSYGDAMWIPRRAC